MAIGPKPPLRVGELVTYNDRSMMPLWGRCAVGQVVKVTPYGTGATYGVMVRWGDGYTSGCQPIYLERLHPLEALASAADWDGVDGR